MTWLGKILALLAMVVAVVWMWFTVSVFVARTNWKKQADDYKAAYAAAKDAREAEYKTSLAEKDALLTQLASEKKAGEKLASQLDAAKTDLTKTKTDLAAVTDAIGKLNAQFVEVQAQATADRGRADNLQGRVAKLEEENIKATVIAQQAVKDKQAAETLARQATTQKNVAEGTIENLKTQLAEEKQNRPGGPAPLIGVRPAPVPEGARGTVDRVDGAFLEVSIGIDQGITNGATLDVYRTGAQPKYLGTMLVDRAYPQKAVGTFTPAAPRRRLGALRADELPKAGDRVGRVGSVASIPAN